MSGATPAQGNPVHLMTIEMGAWCGATGPRFNGRASSAWREVTCADCHARRTAWFVALVWDMLQAMPASHAALSFAVRAGRLGVTDEQGRPLAMACITDGDASARDALDAQALHDSPGSDLGDEDDDDPEVAANGGVWGFTEADL